MPKGTLIALKPVYFVLSIMRVSSRSLVSPAMTIALTAVVVAAIAVILFAANVTIINAQQQQQQQQQQLPTSQPPAAAVTQNVTTLFQSTEDSFRLQVPQGWVIHDVNNTGSMLVEESTQGYGILAQLCPEEQQQQQQQGAAALSNVSGSGEGEGGGGNTATSCQGSEGDIIHIVRYPDLDTRLQAANNITTNNSIVTIDNILLYHMQKLEEVGYSDIEIVDSTDTTLNVTNAQTNQTIATVPAKNVEMTYNTNFAPNETREGYFILSATNATQPNVGMTKAYSIFYEGTSAATAGAATVATIQETTTTTATPSGSLPRPPAVGQVFDSFELIAAQEVIEDMLAAQSEQEQQEVAEEPTNPLTVDITSSDTEEGEAAAPATIEFEADITGGIEPYSISWDFDDDDDGSSEERSDDDDDDDVVVDHTFEEDGSYNVGLTVTDSIGQSASDSMEITVEEAPEEEEIEEEAPAADEVEEEETITPPANETITIEEPAEEVEEEAPAADEVVEEVEPDLDDVDNNSGSDDLFDVDDFLDDLFDRLGLR